MWGGVCARPPPQPGADTFLFHAHALSANGILILSQNPSRVSDLNPYDELRFSTEGTEAQRSEVTLPRSHSWQEAELVGKPGSFWLLFFSRPPAASTNNTRERVTSAMCPCATFSLFIGPRPRKCPFVSHLFQAEGDLWAQD